MASSTPPAPIPPKVLEALSEERLPDGVYLRSNDVILVRAQNAYIRSAPGKDASRLALGYFTVGELEWRHGYLSQGVRRLLADQREAQEAKLTAQQKQALEALPPEPKMTWNSEEQAPFALLIRRWAERQDNAGELISRLSVFASERKKVEDSAMQSRIEAIERILTPQQAERFNPIPAWGSPKP